MNDQGNREAIIAKIRALMSKTIDAGATEAEAMAAMQKAYELLEKYQLSLSDLELKEEGAGETKYQFDEVVNKLAVAVAEFCDCIVLVEEEKKEFVKPNRNRRTKKETGETEWRYVQVAKFIGAKTDAMFAEWLIKALAGFVHGEVLHQELFGGFTKSEAMDYEQGMIHRLNKRLRDEVEKRRNNVANSNSTALIPLKNVLIDEHLAKTFRKRPTYGRSQHYRPNNASVYGAGMAKGDTPALRRPIEREMRQEQRKLT